MKISKKTKKAGIFAATLTTIAIVLLAVVISIMIKPIAAEPQYPVDHLFVEDTYLLKTGETNTSVNITCTPYITNIWDKESGDIKIIVYVVKTSNNIADYKNTVEIGKIAANSTAELEVPIILSENSYRVDMLIFENEKLVLKGSVSIKAHQVIINDIYGKISEQYWELENTHSDFQKVIHDQ